MLRDYMSEYKSKLRTPEEAVAVVKSGDWIDYTSSLGKPTLLDRALAKRKDELYDVKVRGNLIDGPIMVAECDEENEHFIYHSWHCSSYERKLCDRGLCYYIPMVFHNNAAYYEFFLKVNVAMVSVSPMDRHGYFNFSVNTGVAAPITRMADIVIVEVNEHMPKVYGGYDECIHISDVDYIVEGAHEPFSYNKVSQPTEIDRKISEYIVPYLVNGATLQLGIGSMPNALGELIAVSDLKDLGMHTELCSDAFLSLYKSGKLTNRKKSIDRGKGVYGCAIGSKELYDWLEENHGVAAYPLEYVNRPSVIAQIDNMVSINSCVAVDLYGQVAAESAGARQISGTGGQLDFLVGASASKGGKAFICMSSLHTDRYGVKHSRIKPQFNGDIVTSPRSQVYFLVTEYGIINLEGRSTWERAEDLISIAHPDFRDELILEAEKRKIWRKSNKR
ncbi:MAG: acetyl-CoA hydrolase/transferase C-terminal domain-containing protein [Eubacteriales bacterium]|nr:acetyl-CoA hydrolase/transferase C-terminal domain-containing protein [Lachnospiraceae bacterium]MDO5126503.1 acetyl-CoA hydrolase/transferase C-terminal domain-containing protein [Eubacteriales bacterium]